MDLNLASAAAALTGKAGQTAADAADAIKRGKIKDTAQKFEAAFVSAMLQPMFENLNGGEFGGGEGEDMFKSLLTEAMGRQVVRSGGVGLAASVTREMLKLQGLTEKTAA